MQSPTLSITFEYIFNYNERCATYVKYHVEMYSMHTMWLWTITKSLYKHNHSPVMHIPTQFARSSVTEYSIVKADARYGDTVTDDAN
jgi:hypothetical protein